MILMGTALVLALVVLQPIALGFFPVAHLEDADCARGAADPQASESHATEGSDAARASMIGTGDMTAGALSALIRDLNTDAAAAPQARSVSPVVLVLLANMDPDAARRRRAFAAFPAAPATTRGGSSALGYPLLL